VLAKGNSYFQKIFSYLSWVKKMFFGNKVFGLGMSIFLVLAFLGLFEPLINNYRLGGRNPISLGVYPRFLWPSFEHPLGTDIYGRDILSLLLVGLRNSLFIGFLAGSVGTMLAVTVGIVAAYEGGIIDKMLSAFSNVMLVIPTWPILIFIASLVHVDLVVMALILAFFYWPGSARLIRSMMLSFKERQYVDLAKVSGLSSSEIMFKEILPNIAPYIGVGLSTSIIMGIGAETGMRMIGLGPPELMSLGQLMDWAMGTAAVSTGYWHILLAPILTLAAIFISLQLINMGLEEQFNPRIKEVTGA
jgi:peptide/nickel transport system permease protein